MSFSHTQAASFGPLARNRPLRRLLIAQFGTTLAVYALGLAGVAIVEGEAHSSAGTGMAIVASIFPAFLGSLISGAVVDRWGRVRVLLTSHLLRGLVGLIFWLVLPLLPLGWELALVYAASASMALLSQFAMPAELALLPDMTDKDQLVTANTLYQFGFLIAEGVGLVVLGPVIIKLAGPFAVGLLAAFVCLIALFLAASLPRGPEEALASWEGWRALCEDLRTGWRTIAGDRLLRLVVFQATLAAALLLALLSLVPGIAVRQLGMGVEDAPFLILPGGVGFAVGAFLVNRLERRLSRLRWISWGLVLAGMCIGLLALTISGGSFWLWASLVPIIGVGLALAWVIIPARAVLEERPPPEARARVIAAQLALGNALAVLPLLLGGSLADAVGLRPVMGLIGLLALGAGIAGWLLIGQETESP